MSYNLIRKINEQLLKEVPRQVFPFQYGTIGSLLASLMIPVYGTKALSMIQNDLQHLNLNVDEGSLFDLRGYIEGLKDPLLKEVGNGIFDFIDKTYFGILRNFFEEEVWQIDASLGVFLEGKEEFRDSLLLFVFSIPVFPVSMTMKEVLVHFHIFESDEAYVEMQSILNEYYCENLKCQRNYLAWKHLDMLPERECRTLIQKLEKTVPFLCDGCGKDIKHLKAPYITRVEIYPSRNLSFDLEDGVKDFESEVYNLYQAVSHKSEKETTKEMWTEYRLFLCRNCRTTFVKRIENGEFI